MSTTRFVFLGLVLAAGASCFEATPPKSYPCTVAHPECPTGQVCRGGWCVDPASAPDCRAVDGPTQLDQGYCGDGVKNGEEECDGKDLGGATCEKLCVLVRRDGACRKLKKLCYGPGKLACKACKLSTAGCTSPKDRPQDYWVLVEKGTFTMGSPNSDTCREDDEEQHQVTLTRSFWIQATEVTQGQYKDLMKFNPSFGISCGLECPVEAVYWVDAVAYCNALSVDEGRPPCYQQLVDKKKECKKETDCGPGESCAGDRDQKICLRYGNNPAYPGDKIYDCPGYRLPTEAEWELAYRHKTTTDLYNGPLSTCIGKDPKAGQIAWYEHNSDISGAMSRQPVAGKQPNGNCLFDMAGNIWEWCHDFYKKNLGTNPVTDPVVTTGTGTNKVTRGGGFKNPPHRLRGAERAFYHTTHTMLGFRCVRTHLQAKADGGPSSD